MNAAVFSDGHVEGDPKAVGDIYSARRGAYKALEESIELLNSIGTSTSLYHMWSKP